MWPETGKEAQEAPLALRAPRVLTTDRVPVSHPVYAVVSQYWQTHKTPFCVGEQHLGLGLVRAAELPLCLVIYDHRKCLLGSLCR